LLCPIGGASTDAAGRVIIGVVGAAIVIVIVIAIAAAAAAAAWRARRARDSRRERAIDDFMGESEFPEERGNPFSSVARFSSASRASARSLPCADIIGTRLSERAGRDSERDDIRVHIAPPKYRLYVSPSPLPERSLILTFGLYQ